jgi:hypothetical protein
MAPLRHDEDITRWLQLLRAIEEAEAGRGTARLTEICLSAYAALAAAEFQVTQLRARVHVLTTSRSCLHEGPVTAVGARLHPIGTPTASGVPSVAGEPSKRNSDDGAEYLRARLP